MKKLSAILVATDVRPASEQAERVAARLAGAFGAGLTLYHVFEPVAGWPVTLHQEQEQMAQVLRRRAARLREESAGAFPCAVAVGVGPVADTVLRKAEELGAGLIVIGGGVRRSTPSGWVRWPRRCWGTRPCRSWRCGRGSPN
jgi:nucleotide-binding universal stress UspA family protein